MPRTNPLSRYGGRSKCVICQSTYRWVKDCPHKNEQVKLTEENVNTAREQFNITLFSNESASDTGILIVDRILKSNKMLLVTYTWLADVNASVAKCLCF